MQNSNKNTNKQQMDTYTFIQNEIQQQIQEEQQMEFRRPILTDANINKKYQIYQIESDNILQSGVRHCMKHYKPNRNCATNYFLDRFPLFKWLFKYNPKTDFLSDLVAGITVGIVHIPQSLAYTMLSGLPIYVGLYVSIFPVLAYFLLGTTRHLSIGTFAIPAIMTASTLYKYEGVLYPASSHRLMGESNSTFAENLTDNLQISEGFISMDPVKAKIQIGMCLAFLTGFLQLLFAMLHFGFVTRYLSDAIVTGFTTGAAFHIVLTQISSLLGFKVAKTKITFKFVGNCIELFKNIHMTNYVAVIISAITMVFLYLIKEQINHRFAKKMFMPVPVELLVVFFGTLFSYLFHFHEKWNVDIVGPLPKGIPLPTVPLLNHMPKFISDALSIAIVTFAINISLSKFFAKKYKYEINPNQELFAYGIGNIATSFFPAYPACASLSRCAILEATNSKSQIYAIVSSILVIIVCMFLGPLFRTLPNPCLASIIVIALKNMMFQIFLVPNVYRTSKLEAMAWIGTFAGVMILDVDLGLYIGVALSLIMVIFKTQRPRVTVLGNIPNTELYESIQICDQAFELNGIKIIRYEESLYYANVDNFKYQIIKCVGVRPEEIMARLKQIGNKKAKKPGLCKKPSQKQLVPDKNEGLVNQGYDSDTGIETQKVQTDKSEEVEAILSQIEIKHIILDCSPFNYVDSMAIDTILQLKDNYEQVGIALHLSNCKPDLLKMLKKKTFAKRFDFNFIYPTVHDAVHAIIERSKMLLNESTIGNVKLNRSRDNDVCSTIETSNSSIFISSHKLQDNLIKTEEAKHERFISRF